MGAAADGVLGGVVAVERGHGRGAAANQRSSEGGLGRVEVAYIGGHCQLNQ